MFYTIMGNYVVLMVLLAGSISLSYGQTNCMYLNTDWLFAQTNTQAAVNGNFNLNVDRTVYTIGSNLNGKYDIFARQFS